MGKLVVVTGASSGIGKAIAKRMSDAGHSLLLLARRVDKVDDLPNSMIAKVDVTDKEAFENAVKEAEEKYGPVECLVNCAGLMLLGDVAVQDPKEWQKMYDLNVVALLGGMQIVLDGMKQRESGTIVNISSIAGRKTFPSHAAYCGTKFAVHAISENVREEVADHNVRVVTIAPGAVETELLSHTSSDEIKEDYNKWKESMGGVLNPDDIAQAVVYAFEQPQNVCVREIVIAATKQQP
jgi:NADP-dependent 3-hydroxy acid dehydrogenase YdfG